MTATTNAQRSGLKPARSFDPQDVLKEIRANIALLDACERHDFSVAIDRRTKAPVDRPTLGCEWKCSRCGGRVDNISRGWYERGLAHAAPKGGQ